MDLCLQGKSALVTGSSTGIGFAIAEALHVEGCHVILNGRDEQKASIAARRLAGSISLSGDVTDPMTARRLVEQASASQGKLDILICNVGGGQSVAPGAETPEEWQRVFALNLWSATNMVEAAREALVASRGTIICISSICGLEVIPGAPITYSAAKAALHAFVRGVARPLGKQGVRINAIAPGNVLFEESVWSRKIAEDRAGVEEVISREVSLGRFGSPQEIADLVAFAASPLSAFATGQIWTLDGGQSRA